VVIAIIAILAAILFPVFSKVREKARQTSCISNQKQIGIAIAMYANDWDDKIPGAWQGWYTRLDGYGARIKDKDGNLQKNGAFECPNGPAGGGYAPDINRCWVMGNSTGYSMSMFDRPQSQVYLWESGCDSWSSNSLVLHPAKLCMSGWNWQTSPATVIAAGLPDKDFRHSGGSVVLFMDGHVEYAKAGKLAEYYNYWNGWPMWP